MLFLYVDVEWGQCFSPWRGLLFPGLRNLPAPIGCQSSDLLEVVLESFGSREGDMFFVEAVGKDYVGHGVGPIEKAVNVGLVFRASTQWASESL